MIQAVRLCTLEDTLTEGSYARTARIIFIVPHALEIGRM